MFELKSPSLISIFISLTVYLLLSNNWFKFELNPSFQLQHQCFNSRVLFSFFLLEACLPYFLAIFFSMFFDERITKRGFIIFFEKYPIFGFTILIFSSQCWFKSRLASFSKEGSFSTLSESKSELVLCKRFIIGNLSHRFC